MTYFILYILLAALCFWNIRFSPVDMDIKTIMNRMNRLRFVFAIFIVFTHCTLPYENNLPLILLPLRKVSTFGVGYFFIVSGYGLAYSVANKPTYLHNFWKKIVNLLWLTLFSSVVSILIQNLAMGKREPLRLINWYMPAMIMLYLIFYIAYLLFPISKSGRNLFLAGAVFVIISGICLIDNLTGLNHRNYYISELAFPFGVFIYEYSDYIARLLKKKGSLLIIALAEVIWGSIALIVPERGLLDLLFHNLMLIPVGCAIIWFLDKFEVTNPALTTMNRYSLFIYLFQFAVLAILKDYYTANNRPYDVFYFLICLGLTCILAVILQNLYDFVEKNICKRLFHKH